MLGVTFSQLEYCSYYIIYSFNVDEICNINQILTIVALNIN